MKTILYEEHLKLGAKIVDFSGWQMPVSYQGIIAEHRAVREHAGLFDVSHMGRIGVRGKDAEAFLDWLSTNKIVGKKAGQAIYTVLCQEDGGCVDDVLIYKRNPEDLFLIANASNRENDLHHLQMHATRFDVEIISHYLEEGILALQGPKAVSILSTMFPEAVSLKHMHFLDLMYKGSSVMVSRTGYTGADGFEFYAANHTILDLWQKILVNDSVMPCGLGARDTLRLEMGYALYGHEISSTIFPTESVSAWTVKWEHDFLGKKALEDLEKSLTKRAEYGILLQGNGIAREGFLVFQGDQQIGQVTSGTHSPCLGKGIALILSKDPLQLGEQVEVQIRQARCPALVVSLPFYKN